MISKAEHSHKQICKISEKPFLLCAIGWILSSFKLFCSHCEVHFNRLYDLFGRLGEESAEHIAFLLLFQYFEVE